MSDFETEGDAAILRCRLADTKQLLSETRAQLDAVIEERNKAMRALESLTPSGSEFAGDPSMCAKFMRKSREAQQKTIIRFKSERDAAQARADKLEADLAANTHSLAIQAVAARQADMDVCTIKLDFITLGLKCHNTTKERDALKARVAKLEATHYRWYCATCNLIACGNTCPQCGTRMVPPLSEIDRLGARVAELEAAIESNAAMGLCVRCRKPFTLPDVCLGLCDECASQETGHAERD